MMQNNNSEMKKRQTLKTILFSFLGKHFFSNKLEMECFVVVVVGCL